MPEEPLRLRNMVFLFLVIGMLIIIFSCGAFLLGQVSGQEKVWFQHFQELESYSK